ncbi:MAG: Rrf2 family transcriptional regulator [Planctomycetota bacterium]|nr:Rrf2 family transcriptional regulator [Planctomycetota bacterium]MDG2083895.1 Rrf2 family transcriptional regulator [Planctomycetota bacterium]
MTHLYSRGIEYALRCLQLMAQNPAIPRTVVELCEEAQLPEHFTRKMLQPLVRAGYLKSNRGPGGGFLFAVPPEKITLKNVVEGIEGKTRKKYCLLGGSAPAPLDKRWTEIWDLSEQLLVKTTVADLIKGWDGTDRIQSESGNSVTTIQAMEDKEAPGEEKGRRYLPRN